MTRVETFENENNLEAHIEKKKKRRSKKFKKVAPSDVTGGPTVSEPANPGSNAAGLSVMKLDTPSQNEAQKKKRIRRRKRNKNSKVVQGEGVIETENKKDGSKNISNSGDTVGPSGEGPVSVVSNAEDATPVMSSNVQKKRTRRRNRNKSKAADSSLDAGIQTVKEDDSNATNLKDVKPELSHVSQGNLNVTTIQGNAQEKSETQKKRKKRKNKKKTSVSEGDVCPSQTPDPAANTSVVNDVQPVPLPGKKRRNRKRKRNHSGTVAENTPSVGDGIDKKTEANSDEPIPKLMKITAIENESNPPQNSGEGIGTNKKKRRRNRRKRHDKDKVEPQSDIVLPHDVQENGTKVIEDNERTQNRKRSLESCDKSRLVDVTDLNQENDQTNIEEKNDEHAVKKTKLSIDEENGTQNVEVGSSPKKRKRQRNRKRKFNKEAAQGCIDSPSGLQENGVEANKDTESAKGEKGGIERNSNLPESEKKDLLGVGENGTNVDTLPSSAQLVKQESNDSEKKNDELVKVLPLEEGGTPTQNTGAENNSNKKKKHRNRHKKRNREHKEKSQDSVNAQDISQNGAGIISTNENSGKKERDSEGKDSMLDSKSKNLLIAGENGTVSDNVPLEQGSNQTVSGKKKRRRNRKKHNQSLGTEIKSQPQEKVSCEVDVAESKSDATVDVLKPEDGTQASDDGCNSPHKMEKTKDEEVIESHTCGSTSGVTTELNSLYVDDSCKNEIHKHWTEEQVPLCKDTGLEVTMEPFKCCYAPDFLKNADYLDGVKDELQDIELIMKSNDLYKFRQTSDLKNITTPHIAGLRRFLYGDFRKWLMDITGIPLNDTVDMGSSRYEYTDVLLCHDDELEGRRIAYILYLVPPWEKADGGSLDLFSTDEHAQPKDIVKSFTPKWNAFAFFEVSPVSYHQVAEVLSCDKVRLSINGWFHGPPIERPPKYIPPTPPLKAPIHIEEEELYSWINPTYLDPDVQREIRHKFRSDSEIELESFLAEDKYQALAEALKNSDLSWQWTGPPNKHLFEALKLDKLPAIVDDCIDFLKSEAVFLIVSQLTGLKLHRLTPPDSEPDSDTESKELCPRVNINVRRWSHGCYTLIRDDFVENKYALDANLFINVSDKWSQEHGGFISYIAKDQDEELLTVEPRPNRFALVYRDAETLRFTKHINASVSDLGNEDSCYNDFACVYYE